MHMCKTKNAYDHTTLVCVSYHQTNELCHILLKFGMCPDKKVSTEYTGRSKHTLKIYLFQCTRYLKGVLIKCFILCL
jgi:hypothetical protein